MRARRSAMDHICAHTGPEEPERPLPMQPDREDRDEAACRDCLVCCSHDPTPDIGRGISSTN